MNKIDFKTKKVFSIDGLTLAHQYGSSSWGKGFHRIASIGDACEVVAEGAFELTDHPAFFMYGDNTYMVLTNFYEDEGITEIIFKLTPARDVDEIEAVVEDE